MQNMFPTDDKRGDCSLAIDALDKPARENFVIGMA